MKTDYTVTEETIASLESIWRDSRHLPIWSCLFVVPAWLKAWWPSFGGGWAPFLRAVRHRGELIGIAPLMIRGKTAAFMGRPDVCDYLDFVLAPGREVEFFKALDADLRRQGIEKLQLDAVRGDAATSAFFEGAAERRRWRIVREPDGVALATDLPTNWDAYLQGLGAKQRHEVRRKFRRLKEASTPTFRAAASPAEVAAALETLMALFKKNRRDKADFMTEQMAVFFRRLAASMDEAGMLKLFTLKLDAVAAAVLCFDYRGTRYLYNNAYDRRFSALSVGFLSKVLSLKEAIQAGLKRYDFLKGGETYKRHLGGRPHSLFSFRIELG